MFFKIEKFLFLALIFSIPFQKRFFLFGPNPELVEGFEWSSGFIYFTDFLVVLLAAFWLKDFLGGKNFNPRIYLRLGPSFLLAVFLGLAFLSLSQADLPNVAVYRFVKLGEFIFVFFYVATRIKFIGINTTLFVLVGSGVFQSILAILQFAKQSSLGLEVFHESTLAIGMRGVAGVSQGGIEMIRAYGTFPSPNVLAGFLGLCLLFLFYLYLRRSSKNATTETPNLLYGILLFLLTFGLALTFSRGVIIFFLFTSILLFAGIFLLDRLRQYRKQAINLVILVVVSWLLIIALARPEVSARFLGSSIGEPAIQERLFFNEVGFYTVRQNYTQLFFGVGIGNFVQNYMQSLPGLAPHLYQPVHNIFILIASEIGVFGLIAFVLFLTSLLCRAVKTLYVFSLLLVVCFMLFVGMYDHYLLTLQQGSLIFWISLGLLASGTNNYNKKL
ncbi:MAG: O-antigen ligase family protein [Candidatus Spechtbacterales bacterium]